MTPTEPILTWNLFVTAVAVPSLGFYLRHLHQRSEELNDLKFANLERIISEYCKKNLDDHKAINDQIRHHGHACCSDKDSRVVVDR
jgi:hypothetical protein